MSESRIVVLCLASKITELDVYQPLIVLALDRHTVRAASTSRKIVLILFTITVRNCYGTSRKLARIKRVDRMVDGRSQSKRRQHCNECHGENPVTSSGKIVGVCGDAGTERVRARHALDGGGACACPRRATEQRKREGKKRQHKFTHGGIS